ncbi:MAG: hypothetical protein K2X62_15540 [Beijerinckiaceae bacterium]|jgi:hypothetical protein|nr:hypothetical protein [Beijerinckiaceae bacterium]MDO9441618.1 hypothetical protein [Beijerinckiaceae bacterium]
MGLAGPRRPIQVVEVNVDGKLVRGVLERVNDTILVTTREAQLSAPLNGRDPEAVARDLLMSLHPGSSSAARATA